MSNGITKPKPKRLHNNNDDSVVTNECNEDEGGLLFSDLFLSLSLAFGLKGKSVWDPCSFLALCAFENVVVVCGEQVGWSRVVTYELENCSPFGF